MAKRELEVEDGPDELERKKLHIYLQDLDPVIVIELGTKESIHRCIGRFVQPAIHRSIPSVQQGTTEQQSKENFVAWINAMVRNNCTKVKSSRDSNGDELEGCFEEMSCSDLQKVIAAFNELHEWRTACTGNNVSAGRFLAITGNESKMSITRHRLGPFC